MAGFSSIVVIFKRRESEKWSRTNANRFHGMVIHSILASLFCFLPFLLLEFIESEAETMRWCAAVLAVMVAWQVIMISKLERNSHIAVRLQLIIGGLAVLLLQGVNIAAVLPGFELGLYILGVFWQLMQAGTLFVMLIWIPESDVEPD